METVTPQSKENAETLPNGEGEGASITLDGSLVPQTKEEWKDKVTRLEEQYSGLESLFQKQREDLQKMFEEQLQLQFQRFQQQLFQQLQYSDRSLGNGSPDNNNTDVGPEDLLGQAGGKRRGRPPKSPSPFESNKKPKTSHLTVEIPSSNNTDIHPSPITPATNTTPSSSSKSGKPPANAYWVFADAKREEVKRQNPGASPPDIARIIADLWRNVEDKSEWFRKADELKKQYYQQHLDEHQKAPADATSPKPATRRSQSPGEGYPLPESIKVPEKPPRNSFMVFAAEKRKEAKELFPNLNAPDLAKKISEMWQQLKEEDRLQWQVRAEEGRKQYKKDMELISQQYPQLIHQQEQAMALEDKKQKKKPKSGPAVSIPTTTSTNVNSNTVNKMIAISGVDNEEKKAMNDVFQKMKNKPNCANFALKNSLDVSTSHLVVSDKDPKPKRSLKLYAAIAKGCWIVNALWVFQSYAAGAWLSEETYENKSYRGAWRSRQAHASGDPKQLLFHKIKFFIQDKNTTIQIDSLEWFITLCGGEIVDRLDECNICVVANPNYEKASKKPKKSGKYRVVAEDWIIESLLDYSLLENGTGHPESTNNNDNNNTNTTSESAGNLKDETSQDVNDNNNNNPQAMQTDSTPATTATTIPSTTDSGDSAASRTSSTDSVANNNSAAATSSTTVDQEDTHDEGEDEETPSPNDDKDKSSESSAPATTTEKEKENAESSEANKSAES